MKTHRISTTISQKHWELLKKHAEKFETQQKVLELALESLENILKHSSVLTEEEKLWLSFKATKSVCFIQKDVLKLLIETADIERINEFVIRNKPSEYSLEFFFQKPIKEMSLKEVLDGLVITLREINWLDSVDYTDDGGYYMLMITHSLGFNNSIIDKMSIESVFKTYGVKTDSIISEKTIFMKIFKN